MRVLLYTFLLALALTPIPAFADSGLFKLGVIAPLSGEIASYGAVVKSAVERSVSPKVKVIFEDDGCDSKKAVLAYKKLTEVDKVRFIIGPACGSPQKAISSIQNSGQVIVILPNASSESLFPTPDRLMYAVQSSVESEGRFIASEFNKRNLRRVAVVFIENDYSSAMLRGFKKDFLGEIVYQMQASSFDNQHMKNAAVKLRSIHFDSIFLPDIAPLLLKFLTELKNAKVKTTPTFMGYGAQIPGLLEAEGGNAEGLLYSYPKLAESEDAFGYFPGLAAQILSRALEECSGEFTCVKGQLDHSALVSSDGDPGGDQVIKTIKDGKYQLLTELTH